MSSSILELRFYASKAIPFYIYYLYLILNRLLLYLST